MPLIVTGPSEDLGLELPTDGCVNFVFRAVPTLVESFRRYFDWLWETPSTSLPRWPSESPN